MGEGPNQFRAKNHFVPEGYLKRWTDGDRKVWTYQLLVPKDAAPLWRPRSPGGIAYHRHLYTRVVGGSESDDFERWLNDEIENPAQDALDKIASERRLTSGEWKRLIRFIAAQRIRTPARYDESMKRWGTQIPDLINTTLKDSVKRLELSKRRGRPVRLRPQTGLNVPSKITISPSTDGSGMGEVRLETRVGREMWIETNRHILTRTWEKMRNLRWTTYLAPDGFEWITSDDPVLQLNYNSDAVYNFEGGWGQKGTEIMMPVSPRHLLYTKVGTRSPHAVRHLSLKIARKLQRFLIEHAHRAIYAKSPRADIEEVRKRWVNLDDYLHELNAWKAFHEQQSASEREG